jgi:hypothetical protein
MRARRTITSALLAGSLVPALFAAAPAAAADSGPVIVVPGRAGVPVMMWGIDVTGAVIEGEFGLDKPAMVGSPTVIIRYWPHVLYQPASAWFPATGHRPRVGRLEVIPKPHRRLPPPAEQYYRDWMTRSDFGPATVPAPYVPPPVVVVPPGFARHPDGHARQPIPSVPYP